MIDYNAIVQLVGGVGFPIVACCAMAYYIKTTHKELANINGIVNYRGGLSQNLKLIALAKSGKLVRV